MTIVDFTVIDIYNYYILNLLISLICQYNIFNVIDCFDYYDNCLFDISLL